MKLIKAILIALLLLGSALLIPGPNIKATTCSGGTICLQDGFLTVADPRKGFILKYTSARAYQVWDPVLGRWGNILALGYRICGKNSSNQKDCSPNSLYYWITQNPTPNTWNVNTYQATGGKSMYTAVFAVDTANPSTTPAFNANIAPTIIPNP